MESLEEVVQCISEEFGEEEIATRLDEQMNDYVDVAQMEEDNYDSTYDWYKDYCNREAEDDVIKELINWYQDNFERKFDLDEYCMLSDKLTDHYSVL